METLSEYSVPRGEIAFDAYRTPATPNYNVYQGDFARNTITPSDIDGEVEVGGHFLCHEYKKYGKQVPVGQLRLLEAKRQNNYSVVVASFNGDELYPMELADVTVYLPRYLGGHVYHGEGLQFVKSFHRWWQKETEHLSPPYEFCPWPY